MCRSLAAWQVTVMTDRFDVIVIGTGAGGGTIAHTLATVPLSRASARSTRRSL
jgi:pyruvate/2-oxoglutarate dehydrogenase complex dihydrolipoamide dehydrogenase (E3) component